MDHSLRAAVSAGSTQPAGLKTAGIVLAVVSGIFIGTAFVFKKKGLLHTNAKLGTTPGEGHQYLKSKLWWVGMTLLVVGEVANLVAYALAPAILVAPLGAISVVVTAVLSALMLKERLNLYGKIGCILCLLGSVVIVLHSPQQNAVSLVDDFMHLVIAPGFLVWLGIVIIVSIVLVFVVGPRFGHRWITVYLGVCALAGCISVVFMQGVGAAIVHTITAESQLKHPFLYALLVISIGTLLTQLHFLNKALNLFCAAEVTPVYYVLFTTATIVSSAILFQGFDASAIAIVTVVMGFLVICTGVVLIQFSKINDSVLEAELEKALAQLEPSDETTPLMDEKTPRLMSSTAYANHLLTDHDATSTNGYVMGMHPALLLRRTASLHTNSLDYPSGHHRVLVRPQQVPVTKEQRRRRSSDLGENAPLATHQDSCTQHQMEEGSGDTNRSTLTSPHYRSGLTHRLLQDAIISRRLSHRLSTRTPTEPLANPAASPPTTAAQLARASTLLTATGNPAKAHGNPASPNLDEEEPAVPVLGPGVLASVTFRHHHRTSLNRRWSNNRPAQPSGNRAEPTARQSLLRRLTTLRHSRSDAQELEVQTAIPAAPEHPQERPALQEVDCVVNPTQTTPPFRAHSTAARMRTDSHVDNSEQLERRPLSMALTYSTRHAWLDEATSSSEPKGSIPMTDMHRPSTHAASVEQTNDGPVIPQRVHSLYAAQHSATAPPAALEELRQAVQSQLADTVSLQHYDQRVAEQKQKLQHWQQHLRTRISQISQESASTNGPAVPQASTSDGNQRWPQVQRWLDDQANPQPRSPQLPHIMPISDFAPLAVSQAPESALTQAFANSISSAEQDPQTPPAPPPKPTRDALQLAQRSLQRTHKAQPFAPAMASSPPRIHNVQPIFDTSLTSDQHPLSESDYNDNNLLSSLPWSQEAPSRQPKRTEQDEL
ncbi:hypothetical protein H4R35_005605 [Dimargaris xerosporica]|nr:hypothetical protein H4R35_005605 [Dimargaris xerosporica]